MVKVSVNRFILNRVMAIRKEVKAETRRLRSRTLDRLEEIFNVAAKVARGEITHQRIGGKMVRIRIDERKRWLHLAKHVALTMSSIASNIDEKEIHAQLNELERLINETKTTDQSQNEKNNTQSLN